MKGKFITLEGPDGSGKSSQVSTVADAFKRRGYEVVTTREPGGTDLAEKFRALLLNEPMLPLSEILLFAASRYEHTENVIKPALEQGKIVICDRYFASSFAYQGIARGNILKMIEVNEMIIGSFVPDLMIFFNASLDVCAERLAARTGKIDILDKETSDFKRRCYEGYMSVLNGEWMKFAEMVWPVNANKSLSEVTQYVTAITDGYIDSMEKA